MNLICFDTHIVIWAIKGEATPGQEGMIPKAKYLLQKCKDEKQKVLVPAIVLAELLSGTEQARHDEFYRIIQKRFIVPPFDAAAAVHYAKIWQEKKPGGTQATREEIKADCMIVAIAVARGADCVYTCDNTLKKIAHGFIDTRDLPEVPPTVTQMTFDEGEG